MRERDFAEKENQIEALRDSLASRPGTVHRSMRPRSMVGRSPANICATCNSCLSIMNLKKALGFP